MNPVTISALILALTCFVSPSFAADAKSDGQTQVKPGGEKKIVIKQTDKSAEEQSKTLKQPTSNTGSSNNLKNLPYPSSSK